MEHYTSRVRDSILPLSIAKTLPAAFREWRFTERTEDHGAPVETCRLCGQEGLRYHFEIGNERTDETLWVGSHCILKFDVAIVQEGRRLTPQEAKRRLTELTNGIDHQPSFFKVELKRQQHIDDLQSMPTGRVHRFWAALSPAQRKKAIALGHTPPPPE